METATAKKMVPVVGIKLSRHLSAFGVVREVEKALMDVTDRMVTLPSGEPCHMVHIVGALQYAVGTFRSPWAPDYPTRDEAVQRCMEQAPVQIVLE